MTFTPFIVDQGQKLDETKVKTLGGRVAKAFIAMERYGSARDVKVGYGRNVDEVTTGGVQNSLLD